MSHKELLEAESCSYAISNDIPHTERTHPAWKYSRVDFEAGWLRGINNLIIDFEEKYGMLGDGQAMVKWMREYTGNTGNEKT